MKLKPIILLGAGFNADVSLDISISDPHVKDNYNAYPLISDIEKICNYPKGSNVEELLSNDIKKGNFQPLHNLCEKIMGADHWLIPTLLESLGCYNRFFEKFKDHQFLTFNYDSLVECFLMKLGYWNPEEGYGVPVKVGTPAWRKTKEAAGEYCNNFNGLSKVLHLHGTFCVYASDCEITKNSNNSSYGLIQDSEPRFIFNPGCIGKLFGNYKGCPLTQGFEQENPLSSIYASRRIVAPIPDKTDGLKKLFVEKMYKSATKLIKESGKLIVIGYSFNPLDIGSYKPIIRALAGAENPTMLLVSPDADKACSIINRYMQNPKINLIPVNKPFKDWVSIGMDRKF